MTDEASLRNGKMDDIKFPNSHLILLEELSKIEYIRLAIIRLSDGLWFFKEFYLYKFFCIYRKDVVVAVYLGKLAFNQMRQVQNPELTI